MRAATIAAVLLSGSRAAQPTSMAAGSIRTDSGCDGTGRRACEGKRCAGDTTHLLENGADNIRVPQARRREIDADVGHDLPGRGGRRRRLRRPRRRTGLTVPKRTLTNRPASSRMPAHGVDLDDLDHASMVLVPPSPLPSGRYTVRWHATSAEDRDTNERAFTFELR